MDLNPAKLTNLMIESITDDEVFATLPEQIARFVNTAAVLIQRQTRTTTHIDGTYGLSGEFLRLYSQHYWKIDVWRDLYRSRVGQGIGTSDGFISPAQFKETEIYRDLVRHEGAYTRCAGVIADLTETEQLVFGLQRTDAMGAFESEVQKSLSVVADQLIRVLRARGRMATQRANIAQLLLDDQIDAILVVNVRGQVQFANRPAYKLLDRGEPLRIASGKVTSPDPGSASAVRRLIQSSCSNQGGGDVEQPSQLNHYRVSIDPLSEAHTPMAVIRIRDDTSWAKARAEQGRRNYGLTPAETRLAQALLMGVTPSDYAVRRGVALPTVRSQLRSLFAKTGSAGQLALMTRLGRL